MTMTEEWKQHPRFLDYKISSLGNVKSIYSGLIQGYIEGNGYRRFNLKLDGTNVKESAAVLVLETFKGPRPSISHEAAHDDGTRLNNALTNLSWKTKKQNQADRKIHGTCNTGERNPRCKITKETAQLIKTKLQETKRSVKRISSIAKQFDVPYHIVKNIDIGAAWAWLK